MSGDIKIEMTGICKDCYRADLYLQKSEYTVDKKRIITGTKWYLYCRNRPVCKRLVDYFEEKAEDEE